MKQHRTRPEQGEETRSQLLQSARELFAERGYAGVALQDVCDRVSVTRGALYHHFPDKDGLFRALCEDVADDVTDHIVAAAAGQADAWTRLRAGCAAFLDACTDRAVQRILLVDAPSVLGWDTFREIDERHGLGLMKAGLVAAIEEGAVMAAPVDALAHMLVAALNEAAMLISRAPDAVRARRDAALSLERLLCGIATPSA